MTRNSFITLEITWTKEDRACFSVKVGVIELWSHCGAAGSHRSALSKGHVTFTREEVLSLWLMEWEAVWAGASCLKNSPLLS